MACSISISSVTGSQNGPNTTILVQGTIIDCSSGQINLTITCGALTFTGQGFFSLGSVNWTASVPTTCICNGPITITASCSSNPGCNTTVTVANLQCCCPTINLTVTESSTCLTATTQCPNGKRQVTFNLSGNVPIGCTASVQIQYGDTFGSQIYNLPAGPFNFNDYHVYCAGQTYAGVVGIISPQFCQGIPFQVTPTTCPDCNTNVLLELLCNFIQFLMLIAFALATTYFSVPGCPPALFLGILSVIVGVALLTTYYNTSSLFDCIDCVCPPVFKWLGIVVLASGISLFLFVNPLSCNPLPFAVPLVISIAGFGIIFVWYLTLRLSCALTICHFWAAIRLGGLVAGVAITILYFTLPGGILLVNLIVAGIVALAVLSLAQSQITTNENAGNCNNFP